MLFSRILIVKNDFVSLNPVWEKILLHSIWYFLKWKELWFFVSCSYCILNQTHPCFAINCNNITKYSSVIKRKHDGKQHACTSHQFLIKDFNDFSSRCNICLICQVCFPILFSILINQYFSILSFCGWRGSFQSHFHSNRTWYKSWKYNDHQDGFTYGSAHHRRSWMEWRQYVKNYFLSLLRIISIVFLEKIYCRASKYVYLAFTNQWLVIIRMSIDWYEAKAKGWQLGVEKYIESDELAE